MENADVPTGWYAIVRAVFSGFAKACRIRRLDVQRHDLKAALDGLSQVKDESAIFDDSPMAKATRALALVGLLRLATRVRILTRGSLGTMRAARALLCGRFLHALSAAPKHTVVGTNE